MRTSMAAWDAIIGCFQSWRVEYIFGLPSDDLKILSSLSSSDIRFILCRDQRNSLFMASGYALTSDQLAVCIVGKGPALTNTVTGLLEAQNLGVPLLLIASGTGSEKLGTKAFQEADQLSVVKPLVKWAYRVEHPDRLVWALERAAFVAVNGGKGPVYLELPEHVAEQTVPVKLPFSKLKRLTCSPSPYELDAAWAALQQSRRPVILVGGGMKPRLRGSIEPLAAKLGAALFTTASGRGAVDEEDPLFCGVAGLYTDNSIRRIWEEADVVLTLGSRLEETATFEWDVLLEHTPVIQVNVNVNDFSHQYRGDKVLGDGYSAVGHWLSHIHRQPDQAWLNRIAGCKQEAFRKKEEYMDLVKKRAAIHVSEVLDVLQTAFPEDCILVQENGLQDMWSYFYPYCRFTGNSLSIVPSDQTSLGFGAAAAVGASVADRRPVVALVGDGAFNLFKSDFITAVQYRIPLIYLVMSNGGYGWLQYQLNQLNFEDKPFQFVSDTPLEHMNVVEHEHVEQIVIHEKEELSAKLQLAYSKFQRNKLVVVMIPVGLEDVHEKIRHIYGDFPLYEK
ncbi:acetolactate synthase-1/2/3 large subunit [Paenibacillus tianmuensis]|uniref:Acetolactate synthase-1/2/3 large subunit n=1 Tax=Paenibacillus tianmuensis TaxID=624147 RepID=A0A1G4PDN6_9BACL|nr:thiamine pyrophosphate-binding protein [Paenibacillus tianmuensis]SCW30149.1 acetolactate synthase-1/2/3 large subunit [Paenibacillus tianmuensis]